jgi:hypothetical protein
MLSPAGSNNPGHLYLAALCRRTSPIRPNVYLHCISTTRIVAFETDHLNGRAALAAARSAVRNLRKKECANRHHTAKCTVAGLSWIERERQTTAGVKGL